MTLFLDTCVIIYWIEASKPFHGRLMAVLKKLSEEYPQSTFATSRLSFLECCIKPLRDKNKVLLERYHQFFDSADFKFLEISKTIIEQATLLRAEHDLRTPDALQAASAMTLKPHLFLTGDKSFKKVKGLNVRLV